MDLMGIPLIIYNIYLQKSKEQHRNMINISTFWLAVGSVVFIKDSNFITSFLVIYPVIVLGNDIIFESKISGVDHLTSIFKSLLETFGQQTEEIGDKFYKTELDKKTVLNDEKLDEIKVFPPSELSTSQPVLKNPKLVGLLRNSEETSQADIEVLNLLNFYDSLTFKNGCKSGLLDSVDNASEFFDKYLTLENIDSGVFNYNFQFIHLQKCMKKVNDDFIRITGIDKSRLQIMISEELPSIIFMDEARLIQILNNLLVLVYKRSGQEKIYIKIHESTPKLEELNQDDCQNKLEFQIFTESTKHFDDDISAVKSLRDYNLKELENPIFGLLLSHYLLVGGGSLLNVSHEGYLFKASFELELDRDENYKTGVTSFLNNNSHDEATNIPNAEIPSERERVLKNSCSSASSVIKAYATQTTKTLAFHSDLLSPKTGGLSKNTSKRCLRTKYSKTTVSLNDI